jgi:hypothetical protein
MSECVKDRNASYSKEINQLIIPAKAIFSYIKNELGLSESSFIISQAGIKDVIVIDNSLGIFSFKLTFI